MYSLAVLVFVLMSILLFSAPLGFLLTSKWAKNLNSLMPYLIIRRIVLGILGFLGSLVSLFVVIGAAPIAIKAVGLISLIGHAKVIDREYGFFTKLLRRSSNGPDGQQ